MSTEHNVKLPAGTVTEGKILIKQLYFKVAAFELQAAIKRLIAVEIANNRTISKGVAIPKLAIDFKGKTAPPFRSLNGYLALSKSQRITHSSADSVEEPKEEPK